MGVGYEREWGSLLAPSLFLPILYWTGPLLSQFRIFVRILLIGHVATLRGYVVKVHTLSAITGSVMGDLMGYMSKREKRLWLDDLYNEAQLAEWDWEQKKDGCSLGVFVRRRLTGYLRQYCEWDRPDRKHKRHRPRVEGCGVQVTDGDGGDFSKTMQLCVEAQLDGADVDVRTVLGLDAE